MRQLIIWATIVIVIGMCLYPPWLRTGVWMPGPVNQPLRSSYAFLLTPPERLLKDEGLPVDTLISIAQSTSSEERRNVLLCYRLYCCRFIGSHLRDGTGWITASIDVRRLFVQCAAVLFAGGGLAFLRPSKGKKRQ